VAYEDAKQKTVITAFLFQIKLKQSSVHPPKYVTSRSLEYDTCQ